MCAETQLDPCPQSVQSNSNGGVWFSHNLLGGLRRRMGGGHMPLRLAFALLALHFVEVERRGARVCTTAGGIKTNARDSTSDRTAPNVLDHYISAGPLIPTDLPPLSMTPDDLRLKVHQWRRNPQPKHAQFV